MMSNYDEVCKLLIVRELLICNQRVVGSTPSASSI